MIEQQLKYYRRILSKNRNAEVGGPNLVNNDIIDANVTNNEACMEDYKKQMETHMEHLKHTIVNDANIDLIKQKLILTQNYRDELLTDIELDLKFKFPFFFTNPELVRVFGCYYKIRIFIILLINFSFCFSFCLILKKSSRKNRKTT